MEITPARRTIWLPAAVIAMLGLWLTIAPAANAKKPPPPAKRAYFVIFLGAEGGYASSATCMTFTKKRICDLDGGFCGSWRPSSGAGKQRGLSFQISFTEEGAPIAIEGTARIDDRLEKSSMGGAATITVGRQLGNFSLVGREVNTGRCRALVDEFNARAASTIVTLVEASGRVAAPPANKTYFTIQLGADDDQFYSWQADCWRFTGSEMCTPAGVCGQWTPTEMAGTNPAGFSLDIESETHGIPLLVDGHARIESRGPKGSLGGAARLRAGELGTFNFGVAARQTGRRACPLILEEFIHRAQAPAACMAEADFGEPSESPYVLPYPVGDAYVIYQTYCTGLSHWFGYDFNMPIGSQLVAARAGRVIATRGDMVDNGLMVDPTTDSAGNFVDIEHDDGTIAHYAHCQKGSIQVQEGQRVEAGQPIASSGYTGNADYPHLHFDVYTPAGQVLPINFRNAGGRHDPRGGLLQAERYKALPD
jgi:murein DD-endopeptidase MepM/ murein hydrolase activator NlpD